MWAPRQRYSAARRVLKNSILILVKNGRTGTGRRNTTWTSPQFLDF
jgi:hypothetical protein